MATAVSTGEEKKGFWGRLCVWDLKGCSHSVKIRKDFQLRPKLFASLGGDYRIGGTNVEPYFSFLYKVDEKHSVRLNKSILMFQRKMTAAVGGVTLDFSPHIGLRLDDGAKPEVSVRLNNLRPLKLALGCLCVGVAIGLPVRTTKAIPITGLAKSEDSEAVSRLDCEVGIGVQRTGGQLTVPCSEINGIIKLGPSLVD